VRTGGGRPVEYADGGEEALRLDIPSSDAIVTLRWGLRHYWWLFAVVAVAVGVLAPVLFLVRPVTADSEALVVAQRLDMKLAALPRYAEVVFNNGEVARTVAAQFGDGGDLEDVVPNRVSLVAEQDSVVFKVVGHDPSPETAAEIANFAAVAFTSALNVPGEGVGAFTILAQAVPTPESAEATDGLAFAIPLGLAAGMLLGLAAVAMLLVLRRPVLEAADAEQVTGVPALGSVTVPRTGQREFPPAQEIIGVIPLCRSLLAIPSCAVLLVSVEGCNVERRQLAVAMAAVFSRIRKVRFVAAPDLHAALEAQQGGEDHLVPPPDVDQHKRIDELTLVDVSNPLDLAEPLEASTTILVVPAGIATAALRSAVTEHLGGGGDVRLLLLWRGPRVSNTSNRSAASAEQLVHAQASNPDPALTAER
jgi:capsular polysaccharide biosynthesis protein